jgi:hypothetical protein
MPAVAERERLTRLMGAVGFAGRLRAARTPARAAAEPRTDAPTPKRRHGQPAGHADGAKGTGRSGRLAGPDPRHALRQPARPVRLRKQRPGGERASGYEIELQIPLFDWGGARVARAEAMYMQAVHRAPAWRSTPRSQVRERYSAYRSAYDAGVAPAVSRAGAATLPEAVIMEQRRHPAAAAPPNGRPYNPVVTLNGWSLPWRMNDGVKEFHLVAEPVVREIAPGMKANLWGYNGQSPGPTIEVVEGDRVRIFVTNKLPEHTSMHWHGQRLPNGMDGVAA